MTRDARPIAVVAATTGLSWLPGVARTRVVARLLRTDPSTTADLDPGFVEVSGTVTRPVGESIPAPFGDYDCVAAEWTVEEYDHNPNPGRIRGKWRSLATDFESVPFYLADDHGEVAVALGGRILPSLAEGERYRVDVTDETPAPIREFVLDNPDVRSQRDSPAALEGIWGSTDGGDRLYEESTLVPGDEVRVVGRYDPEREAITAPRGCPMVISTDSRRRTLVRHARPALVAAVAVLVVVLLSVVSLV